MNLKLYLLLLQVCLAYDVSGINILGIFEMPSKSLHILGHELLAGLARKGYNVTLISAFPMEEKITNYTHIHIDNLLEHKEKYFNHVIQGTSKLGALSAFNIQTHLVNLTMQSKAMKDFLKSDSKYDVIIQTYALNEGYLSLAHHFNARVIGFVPFSTMPNIVRLTGNSAPCSYVPLPFLGFTDNMNFFQRTLNTIMNSLITLVHKYYLYPIQAQLVKEYFPDFPPLEEIEREKVDLIFSNAHFGNESPRPKTPNIVYIGGYHVQEPQPLTADLQKMLDDAEAGVVFVGFGTNVDPKNIPKEKMDAFLNTFAKTPYKVIFKHDGVLSNKPKNVETIAWVPQKGVLAHPKTKFFVSHGGKGSATESLYYGVPVLCISFFGDQSKNCEDIVEYGYGIHLPYQEVTEGSFAKAFDELNNNPKYKQNAQYRSALFREQEMDPLDRASFWIKHVHKFKGAKHLWPKSATMPLYQYLLLDVWAFIIISILLVLLLIYKSVQYLLKTICKVFAHAAGKVKTS